MDYLTWKIEQIEQNGKNKASEKKGGEGDTKNMLKNNWLSPRFD